MRINFCYRADYYVVAFLSGYEFQQLLMQMKPLRYLELQEAGSKCEDKANSVFAMSNLVLYFSFRKYSYSIHACNF